MSGFCVVEWKADRLIHLFVLDLKSVGNYNNNHCLVFFLSDSVEHHCFSWRSIQAQTFPLTCGIACECSVTLKHLREGSFLCLIKMIRHSGCWPDNSSLSPRWLLTPVSDKHSAQQHLLFTTCGGLTVWGKQLIQLCSSKLEEEPRRSNLIQGKVTAVKSWGTAAHTGG